MPSRDVETGKSILRDDMKATVGFEKRAEATGPPTKSLIRMFGPRGDPQARNLFGVIGYLRKQAGVEFHVASSARCRSAAQFSGFPVHGLAHRSRAILQKLTRNAHYGTRSRFLNLTPSETVGNV